MGFKLVIAIVWPEVIPLLEAKVANLGVGGITLSKVSGFGEYKNLFSRDWLSEHVKVEIFVEDAKVDALLGALQDAAKADIPGAGIAAVIAVDKFVHLRDGTEVMPALPD